MSEIMVTPNVAKVEIGFLIPLPMAILSTLCGTRWPTLPEKVSGWCFHMKLPGFKHLRSLRVSPLGCVPQRDRHPRLIVDLSFYGVNADTVKLATHEAMQFGRALEWLLFRIRHAKNPCYGPIYINKIDISDGFYRVDLAAACLCPKISGCCSPDASWRADAPSSPSFSPHGVDRIPPPAFCAITEMVADIANSWLPRRYAPPHRLEQFANTPPPVSKDKAKGPSALGPSCPHAVDTPDPPLSPLCPHAVNTPNPPLLGGESVVSTCCQHPLLTPESVVSTRCQHPRPTPESVSMSTHCCRHPRPTPGSVVSTCC
jgi:hypothetical protein